MDVGEAFDVNARSIANGVLPKFFQLRFEIPKARHDVDREILLARRKTRKRPITFLA